MSEPNVVDLLAPLVGRTIVGFDVTPSSLEPGEFVRVRLLLDDGECELWVTNAESCWHVHDAIASQRHYLLVTHQQARALSRRDAHERRAATLVQYPKKTG